MVEDDPGEEQQDSTDALATAASGGAIVFGSKIIALGFGFLAQLIMARLLTSAAYGDVVLTLAVVNMVALIAKLGMDDGVMREYPQYEDDPGKAHGVVRACLTTGAISGIVAGGAVFLFAPLIAERIFENPDLVDLLRIAAIAVPFSVLSQIAVSLARGARDARPHAIVNQLVKPFARVGMVALFVMAGYGATGAVVGETIAFIVAGILALGIAWRILPSFTTPAEPMYRSVLAFSIPLIAMQGMGFLNGHIDIFMVGYFLGSSSVGVYNIVLQIANLITAVLVTVGYLLPSVLTRLYKEGKYDAMQNTYQGITKWTFILSAPVFILLFFAPEVVIGILFGTDYTTGAVALQIILAALLTSVLAGLTNSALIGLGENRLVAYLTFLKAVINTALNIILVPIYGIEGAAVGYGVAVIAGNLIGVLVLYRKFNVHPISMNIYKTLAGMVAICIISYSSLIILDMNISYTVIISFLSFPFLVILFGLDHHDEKLLSLLEHQVGIKFATLRKVIKAIQ